MRERIDRHAKDARDDKRKNGRDEVPFGVAAIPMSLIGTWPSKRLRNGFPTKAFGNDTPHRTSPARGEDNGDQGW